MPTRVHSSNVASSSNLPRKRPTSAQAALHEAQKMSGLAEQMMNNISGLVDDVRASKRIRTETVSAAQDSLPQSPLARIPATSEFKQYAEAASMVMEMYKAGEITKEGVRAAVAGLEKRPIDCITFVLMPRDLQIEWVEDVLVKSVPSVI